MKEEFENSWLARTMSAFSEVVHYFIIVGLPLIVAALFCTTYFTQRSREVLFASVTLMGAIFYFWIVYLTTARKWSRSVKFVTTVQLRNELPRIRFKLKDVLLVPSMVRLLDFYIHEYSTSQPNISITPQNNSKEDGLPTEIAMLCSLMTFASPEAGFNAVTTFLADAGFRSVEPNHPYAVDTRILSLKTFLRQIDCRLIENSNSDYDSFFPMARWPRGTILVPSRFGFTIRNNSFSVRVITTTFRVTGNHQYAKDCTEYTYDVGIELNWQIRASRVLGGEFERFRRWTERVGQLHMCWAEQLREF